MNEDVPMEVVNSEAPAPAMVSTPALGMEADHHLALTGPSHTHQDQPSPSSEDASPNDFVGGIMRIMPAEVNVSFAVVSSFILSSCHGHS
jgi:hypothetical protein